MGRLSPLEVRYWIQEAESCEKRQKKELLERNNYPFLIKYYEGMHRIDPVDNSVMAVEQQAVINEYFPNTNALISEIVYQNPDIVAEATKPDAEGNEKIMQGALKYGMDKTESLIENRLALFDMIYAGYSAVEVDHIIDRKKSSVLNLPTEEESRLSLFERAKKRLKKATSEEEAEDNFAKEQPQNEENYATNEKTYIRRWNPLNILFDHQAERHRDSRYIIKKVYKTKAEFDAMYPKFKDKVKAGTNLDYAQHENEKYKKTVLLYEFQIKKSNNEYWNLCIAPSYPMEELDYYKRPYVTNGFNLKIGTLHKYGKVYPISFAQINKKLQDDINNYMTHMMEVAERNIPKLGYNKNKVKGEALIALAKKHVNALIPVDGIPAQEINPIYATNVSTENKELLAMFQQHKEKLWSVSESRAFGKTSAKFATELQIQEAGFQSRQIDIQEGLRMLIKAEAETLKDIIVNFWDGEYFIKITGGNKPEWYTPNVIENEFGDKIITNALADILTGDYEINIDISTALRPNLQRKKQDLIDFANWLSSANIMTILQMQGQQINMEFIKKIAKKFDLDPENLFVPMQPPVPEGGLDEAGVPMPGLPMEGAGGVQPNALPTL